MGTKRIALTAMSGGLFDSQILIRIEGLARPVERIILAADNPYYEHIYQDADGDSMQVFQIYDGRGFYHSPDPGP